jgi:serine/threonine protein kinase
MKGQLIQDKYRILKSLARNTFSETFLATDNSRFCHRRRYVIKKFRPILGNPEAENIRRLFYHEAKMLKRLSGKNRQIPRLYEYFMDGEDFYLVREWIAGLTLKERVEQQGTFSTAEVEDILRSILSFLQYIHSYGIVYRQLKPSTIILRQDNWFSRSPNNFLPVPIYFGGVKDLETQIEEQQRSPLPASLRSRSNHYPQFSPQYNPQFSSVVANRRDYIPPEQKLGQSGFASDLYSLGLTAIYLLTGKHPAELALDSRTKKLLWYREIPGLKIHLVRVIERAICPRMSDRYTSAEQMLKALNSPPINLAMPALLPAPPKWKLTPEIKLLAFLSATAIGILAFVLIILNTDFTQIAKQDNEQYLNEQDDLATDTLNSSLKSPTPPPATTVKIPAFPLGMTQQNIVQLLGEPTQNSSGYWPNSRALLYEDTVSKEITLGYLTDTETTKVRQAEIGFDNSVDLQTIKQQVQQLMQGNYSPAIDRYLDQIYFQTSDRHDFTINNLEGVVQQSPGERIYIGIWDREFH